MNVSDDVVWNTVIDILSESNIYREDFKPTNLPSDSQIERKKVETDDKFIGVMNPSPLQWSEYSYIKSLTDFTLGCDIIITTRQLTVVTLSDDWEQLQELI